MAILQVLETWEGRTGSADDKAARQYTRTFIVRTNNTLDGPLTVMNAPGIPRVFNIYSDANGTVDTGAFCTKVTPRQRSEDPFTWDVTAEFASNGNRPDQNQQNPLARPTIIKLSFEQYQKVLTVDVALSTDPTGAVFPLLNSANESFNPPVEVDDSRAVLTMDRNEATIDFNFLAGFKDTINTDVWMGFDAYTVKLSKIAADQVYENSLLYWTVSYEFHVRPETWWIKILDQGYHELDSSGKTRVILDSRGQPLTSPALLDGHGHHLVANAKPVYLLFSGYKQTAFAALNLP